MFKQKKNGTNIIQKSWALNKIFPDKTKQVCLHTDVILVHTKNVKEKNFSQHTEYIYWPNGKQALLKRWLICISVGCATTVCLSIHLSISCHSYFSLIKIFTWFPWWQLKDKMHKSKNSTEGWLTFSFKILKVSSEMHHKSIM